MNQATGGSFTCQGTTPAPNYRCSRADPDAHRASTLLATGGDVHGPRPDCALSAHLELFLCCFTAYPFNSNTVLGPQGRLSSGRSPDSVARTTTAVPYSQSRGAPGGSRTADNTGQHQHHGQVVPDVSSWGSTLHTAGGSQQGGQVPLGHYSSVPSTGH